MVCCGVGAALRAGPYVAPVHPVAAPTSFTPAKACQRRPMKDPIRPDMLALALGWLREPTAGRVAAIAAVVAAAMVLAIQAAVGGA